MNYWIHGVSVPDDTTFDIGPHPGVKATVHLLGAADTSQWTVDSDCYRTGRDSTFIYPEGNPDYIRIFSEPVDAASDGSATLTVLAGATVGVEQPWLCTLYAHNETETFYTSSPTITPQDGHMTWDLQTGEVHGGQPEGSVDADGVDDSVESQAPNQGDGNNDNIPDYEQDNVTSLPTNGTDPGPDSRWVTLVAPDGTSLEDVTSMDPADAVTPPPAGTTLPAGLTSFTVSGVTPGDDATVSVFNNTGEEVNGYAKYNPGTGAWTMLPADRMEIFDYGWRIDITLTDGGVGDSDGTADGKIVDPGGPAAVSTGDTTPPTITGSPTTSPNAAGWYRSNVRVDWSATDTGSGVATQPPDTTVTTQGANVTATSPLVCDKAPTPNCDRGTLTGLKIDKTAPSVAVTGVRDGATYTLGSAPTPGCSATDPLSGLARPCAGAKFGGKGNGVGTFTYAAAATDRAGNTRAVSVSYRVVYRFDGFAQPLNDPGPPLSVFKAGSTVPVAFALKRANGTTIAPVSKPAWIAPLRGARTSAPINEPVSNAKGTSGTSFVLKNGQWTFNWSTKGLSAGYVYRIGVRLDDGTTHYVNVGLR